MLETSNHSTLSSPELILAMISLTDLPSTVAPSELLLWINHYVYAVPKIYLTVPVKVLANDFSSSNLATFFIYSMLRLPLCLTIYVYSSYTILDLLSVSLMLSQLLDEEWGWCRLDGDFCCSVLTLQLNHDSDALPFASLLDDILTNFFWVLNNIIIIILDPKDPTWEPMWKQDHLLHQTL